MSVSWKFAAAAVTGTALLSVGAPAAEAAGSLHGSIAVDQTINGNPRSSWGATWNYPSQTEAENAALRECGGGGCQVIVSWANGCGAVVGNDREAFIAGGVGATPAEAEDAARANAIAKYVIYSPQPASGSSAGTPAQAMHVMVTKCTG